MFSHLPTHFQGAQDMKHSQKVAFLRSGRDHVALPSTPIAAEDTINVSTQQILAEIACLRSLQTLFHVLRRGPAGGAAASTQQQSQSESHPPSMPMAPCFNRFRWRLEAFRSQNPSKSLDFLVLSLLLACHEAPRAGTHEAFLSRPGIKGGSRSKRNKG